MILWMLGILTHHHSQRCKDYRSKAYVDMNITVISSSVYKDVNVYLTEPPTSARRVKVLK